MNHIYNYIFPALLVLALVGNVVAQIHRSVDVVPAAVSKDDSKVQFISNAEGLDGPKVEPVNGTVFDWWYFDAVADDAETSFVITFFTSTSDAFPFLGHQPLVTSVYMWASFPNGTTWYTEINATEAIIVTEGNGSSGQWKNTGASWNGTSDMKTYIVTVDNKKEGIVGTFKMKSIAPAHYGCGPAIAGLDMRVGDHIGWSNAVPDSNAVIDMTILGSKLKFKGSGYHDKNWSDRPFFSAVGSWYWGHARLGPYSIVWFDFLSPTQHESVNGYISYNSKILKADCSGVKVRPFGDNATYPPTILSAEPAGFDIAMDYDFVNKGTYTKEKLIARVTKKLQLAEAAPLYSRWSGTIQGKVGDSSVLKGYAIFEQFKLFGLDGML